LIDHRERVYIEKKYLYVAVNTSSLLETAPCSRVLQTLAMHHRIQKAVNIEVSLQWTIRKAL